MQVAVQFQALVTSLRRMDVASARRGDKAVQCERRLLTLAASMKETAVDLRGLFSPLSVLLLLTTDGKRATKKV